MRMWYYSGQAGPFMPRHGSPSVKKISFISQHKLNNYSFNVTPSRELAQSSPYYESLKKRDVEVLFCYEMYDELVLLELKQFGGRQLVSVENDMQKEATDNVEPLIGMYLLTLT